MADPLKDPRAKLRRAHRHLEELDREWDAWLKSNPYAVLPYANTDKTEWKFAVHRFDEAVKPESDTFGLIIGDYVNCVRSALDHLAWALVTVANGITPKHHSDVSFPVVTTHPRDFWSRPMITREEITFEQALFLEGFQSYRTFNDPSGGPLANLHALWNVDKHQLVTAVSVTIDQPGPTFGLNDDAGQIVGEPKWDAEVSLEGDAEIAWVTIAPVGPEPKVDVTNLPVHVAFGKARTPIDALPALWMMADQIVENCARFFR